MTVELLVEARLYHRKIVAAAIGNLKIMEKTLVSQFLRLNGSQCRLGKNKA